MLEQAASMHLGLCVPYASTVFLFVLRNQFKLAIMLQFATFFLCLSVALKSRGLFAGSLLARLLVLSTLLRYFRIDTASGEIVTMSEDDFWHLIHILGILVGLQMIKYDSKMRKRRHRRDMADKKWREEAKNQHDSKKRESGSSSSRKIRKSEEKEPTQLEINEREQRRKMRKSEEKELT